MKIVESWKSQNLKYIGFPEDWFVGRFDEKIINPFGHDWEYLGKHWKEAFGKNESGYDDEMFSVWCV